MSLTVSGEANYIFNQYTLLDSDTYKENVVDESTVAKEKYNVSNLENALESLNTIDSADVFSIGDISEYANSKYTLSQLDSYDTINTYTTTTTTSLLSGTASLDDIYGLISESSSLSSDELESIMKSIGSTEASSYGSYLSGSGSIFDIIA